MLSLLMYGAAAPRPAKINDVIPSPVPMCSSAEGELSQRSHVLAGLDRLYPDAVGRPISLLRCTIWTHTLTIFANVILQLSSFGPLRRAYYASQCLVTAAFMLPSWLAPSPWRHLAFACTGLCFTQYCIWIRSLLFVTFAETQVRTSVMCHTHTAGGIASSCNGL